MTSYTNPALSDGTKISDLIDLDTREVKMRTLSDPELYNLEMKKIFARTWVFLGHETEIPNKGDYVVRDMGSDSVIVARSGDNQIYVSPVSYTHLQHGAHAAEQGAVGRRSGQCRSH